MAPSRAKELAEAFCFRENSSALGGFDHMNAFDAIPRLLHFIWLGKELPFYFRRLIDTFRAMNEPTGWRVILWRNEDCSDFELELSSSSYNVGLRADVLRYQVPLPLRSNVINRTSI